MTPLHHLGEFLRALFAAVPAEAARYLFVALYAALLIWVVSLPKSRTSPPEGEKAAAGANLKVWAALTLALQILLYLIL